MKKRSIVLCMMMVLVMMVCSACASSDVDVQINENGSVVVNTTTLLKKTETDLVLATAKSQVPQQYLTEIQTELTKNDIVTEDGVDYYCIKENKECANEKEVQTYLKDSAGFGNVSINANHFYGSIVQGNTTETVNEEQMDQRLDSVLAGSELTKTDLLTMVNDTKATITMRFPNPVTYSNGTFEQGNNQVTWNFSSDDAKDLGAVYVLYAETTANSLIAADKTAPAVTGIKNEGVYKSKEIKATDKTGVAGVLLNGNAIENGAKISSVAKEGKNTITVYDFSMNKKVLTVTYDKTKPVVKGVANGKIYKKTVTIKFSDKYGVKSAKLNGKTIKSGKKVTKKGAYTLKVTDKAGNVKTVKFKIKK